MHIKYIITLSLIFPSVLFAEINNSEWIEKMKTINANTVNSSLPAVSYEKWFSGFVGDGIKLNWEVNDCGEQDGSGKQKDFPICVEVSANLLKNRKLAISTVLGTHKKGLVGSPKVWMVYIYENEKYKLFKNINEVTSYLSNEKTSNK